ncbi:nicotinamide mononucleotide adenylyltransferase isoform X2 [Lycorma delicatula]|uniref:nicotinamide mononucleotide adenylyltransferase isoform X2 n=1 Tax=Lycorma delicatula TaxID=130591 RepID=UPI003F50E660
MIPSKKVVLLACGSFNPPTNMHLRMFEIARDHLHRLGHYTVIGGIVSPVHDSYGKKELTSAAHRCAMLQLALHNSDWIKVSEWECNQDGWLPTRQVLQYHQNQLNAAIKSTETPKKRQKCQDNENETDWVMNAVRHCSNNDIIHVKLLCGADLLESFGTPNLWQNDDIETIVGEHGLVVITRNECNPYKFIYESDLLTKHMNNIVIVTEWIKNEISSTKIRRALRRFESVKYLIADSVVDYIRNNMLYTTFDTKYQLIPNNTDNMMGSIFLTPSPSDVVMTSPDVPVSNHLRIDVPDGSGKYISKRNDENIMRSKVKSVPGVAVQLVEEVGKAVRPASLLSND